MPNHTTTINPSNNQPLFTYPLQDAESLQQIAYNSGEAFKNWRKKTIQERANYLQKIIDILRTYKEKWALIATQEMGKPIQQSIAEVEKCADALAYYMTNSASFLQPKQVATGNSVSFVCYQPIGTVLAIMPWNYPFWQVFRVLGPILMAGNTMILKHASNVSGCSNAIAEIIKMAQLPIHVFQNVICNANDVTHLIAAHQVQAVTFTGSTAVGKKIAALSGANIKKTVLELGGSDAYIVLEDADLVLAAKTLAQSRMNNAGQSCIGAKRIIVMESIKDDFLNIFQQEMQAYTFGNPEENDCKLGPMASHQQRDALHKQVIESVAMGAKLLIGGSIPKHLGAYYPPTILTDITKNMPAYSEEFFGPVAIVLSATSEQEAIFLANDTKFGLGGGIFSKDIAKATNIARASIEAGTVAVNSCVASNPLLPFGGIKESGYGRELSEWALYEFSNIKSVVVK